MEGIASAVDVTEAPAQPGSFRPLNRICSEPTR